MEEGGSEMTEGPIFKDIRRYYCEYCGICRSKKTLISSHILSHHEDEVNKRKADDNAEKEGLKSNTCEECGLSFKKPAHLKQHMQSHLLEGSKLLQVGGPPEKLHRVSLSTRGTILERPFVCPVDDCNSSYRRKDHLNRHLLQHQGKLFECTSTGCNRRFSIQSNMKKHVKKYHDDSSPTQKVEGKLFECPSTGCSRRFSIQSHMKKHVKKYHDDSSPIEFDTQKECTCPEPGCGKVFKYASRLKKHEDSHVMLESTEAFCSDPGCMKYFTNEQCLKAHIQSCHRYVTCEVCGTKQLKKNLTRHLLTHEAKPPSDRIKCSFEDCLYTFSTKSNLRQHMKAVHFEQKSFPCSIPGCGMSFTYKHVRDNHEKSGCHLYIQGDFLETDEQFRSRPRGGLKRVCPTIETFTRKRVIPPSTGSDSIAVQGPDYLSWLLSSENEEI